MPTLREEARYFHDCLFRGPMEESIAERYEAAHRALFAARSRVVDVLVARRLDVEAVEFALRRRQLCPELTRKILILSYLVEARADHEANFIATRAEPLRAVVTLCGKVVEAGWKLVKGELLIRIYGLR